MADVEKDKGEPLGKSYAHLPPPTPIPRGIAPLALLQALWFAMRGKKVDPARIPPSASSGGTGKV